jgi:hypothetical protein
VGLIGFLLSPLSWWNDLFINVPLALAFAWLVSWFHQNAFAPSFVVGYWLTNLLGLILMQWGAYAVAGKEQKWYTPRQLRRDLLIAILYTGVILLLVKLRIVAPVPEYFSRHP